MYRSVSSPERFSPDQLLDQLNIGEEHDALELADHVEAAMYVWRRKASTHHSKSSWKMVKELVSDEDKNVMLASRAESLLLSIKQRFPALSQTTLDTSKIQYNKVKHETKEVTWKKKKKTIVIEQRGKAD